jgi:carboxylesterase type B
MTILYHLLPDSPDKPRQSNCKLAGFSIGCSVVSFISGFALCFVQFGWPEHQGITQHLRHNTSVSIKMPLVSTKLFSDTVIELPMGQVHGVEAIGPLGRARSFLGIPYGVAERWQVPQPAPPWYPQVLDATRYGKSCVRPRAADPKSMGEDCLHLNVFLPPKAQGQTREKYAVLVWLHGGSFLYETADETSVQNLRELLLTNHMIVVAVEYRLGILGFLASRNLLPAGPSGPIGNLGILDQQLAMKWVGKHIENFFGDPKRITLVGWSAGAASVSVHLASSSSQGLFHRAIMLSGGFVSWAAEGLSWAEQSYTAVLQASGCDKSKDCLEEGPPCACLLNLNVSKILELDNNFFAAPTVDGRLLPYHPMDALRLQKINGSIPIIIGTAIEDSFVDIGAWAGGSEFKAYLKTVLPNKSLVEKAYSLYTESSSNQNILNGPSLPMHRGWSRYYWLARRAYADSVMTCRARRVARLWQKSVGAPAHWYLWGVGRETGALEIPVGPGRVYPWGGNFTMTSCWPCPGAGHGADLDFFFDGRGHEIPVEAQRLSAIYPAFLADFAKHGDPNRWNGFSLSSKDAFAWPPAHEGLGMWFEINESRATRHIRSEVCDFWDAVQA